jgi:hypothetical protein
MRQNTADPETAASYRHRLLKLLLYRQPSRVVLIGQHACACSGSLQTAPAKAPAAPLVVSEYANLEACLADRPSVGQHRPDADNSSLDEVALMSLADTVSALEKVLGSACLHFPWHLLVEIVAADSSQHAASKLSSSEAPPDSANRFFAFGFRRVAQYAGSDVRRALYEYSLHDYKRPPDWLNSRYWAHPDRY